MSNPFIWRGQASDFVNHKCFTSGSTAPINPAQSRSIVVRHLTGSINTETISAADKSARLQGKTNSARSQ
jgi:hypothetical protein